MRRSVEQKPIDFAARTYRCSSRFGSLAAMEPLAGGTTRLPTQPRSKPPMNAGDYFAPFTQAAMFFQSGSSVVSNCRPPEWYMPPPYSGASG